MNAQAEPQVRSIYVRGADGTQLAADVWRAADSNEPGVRKVPTIVQFTRYWRSFRGVDAKVGQPPVAGHYFTSAGYAVVVVDVRGTGASFGAREAEFSDAEVADFAAVFDWIVAQPWSNGRIATIGTSYLGNTAELAATTHHPALKAIVPRFSDFSEYRHAVRPGGVRNAVISKWGDFVSALDRNDPCGAFGRTLGLDCVPDAPWAGGVRPVNGDDVRLKAAVAEHRANANLESILAKLVYSDDSWHRDGLKSVTLDSVSPGGKWQRIDDARVPSYHWASWFDAATAEGVLARFAHSHSPMNVIIGPWTHGGDAGVDPFDVKSLPPQPAVPAQLADIQSFLDPLLKSDAREKPRDAGVIRYFVLGEKVWRTTDRWPPMGVSTRRWHFSANKTLSQQANDAAGVDRYEVDFTASTGRTNRWYTQLGAPVIYADRTLQDQKLLTYTSEPMTHAMEITGTPIAHVTLAPSQSDGALFAYLEDVAPDGRVSYLTEGVLRLTFHGSKPAHTFTRSEAGVVSPGRDLELALSLNPVSALIRQGHRLRIAIAGADTDSFERLPSNGAPLSFQVRRSGSYVDLPMLER